MDGLPDIWHVGYVKGFKLGFYNPDLYNNIIGIMEGKQVEVCVREKSKKASAKTHRLYRGFILGECAKQEIFRGQSEDEIHLIFAKKFLTTIKELHIGDTVIFADVTLSTKVLSQKRMGQFIEDIYRFLAEQGIELSQEVKKNYEA